MHIQKGGLHGRPRLPSGGLGKGLSALPDRAGRREGSTWTPRVWVVPVGVGIHGRLRVAELDLAYAYVAVVPSARWYSVSG